MVQKIPTETIWLPRPAWKYPGCFPKGFEKMIPELLGTDDFLHLFCGMSKIGYGVDIEETTRDTADLIADVHDLSEIEDERFEGAFADPPYTRDFSVKLYGKEYPKWEIWTKEMLKKVKIGGKIAVMHNWVIPRLPGCQYERILVIITRIKQYPKIVTVQKKYA